MIFSILIGVIIFFVGIFIITNSMSKLSNNHFKNFIMKLTKNPLLGALAGIIVTTLTQSSSTTSILVVSLVNSRIINLYQAVPVIMGANIGTTFTAQLISFDFFFLIPYILILGTILFFLRFKNIGKFLIGFSFLFLGIKFMVYSLKPLKDLMSFKSLILSIENNSLKGVFIGIITTAIMQSSSTSVAIIQSLAIGGLINIYQAVPIIMGQNIGTCVTTLLSSIATDKNGKRTAIIHLFFNIIGTLIFYPFINLFSYFIYKLTPFDPVRQIANAHSLFNIINVILLFPFINLMVFISKKVVR
ncbi:Na/Pi cotransporter family protein [Crassaminicella thermophila]|uniref:Na/Pi cotransporter family protein n=1 Tax=Crassaminicella thermophila TaxID=2599308 RepID=UPI00143D1752|nr:Na/Pi symporter [Crassaminicella thermophila]